MLKMNIIMVSSDKDFAYRMNTGIVFIYYLYHVNINLITESGFEGRLGIIDVQQYPKNYIAKYLLENHRNQIQNEVEALQYYDLLGGNMINLMNFKKKGCSLQGFNNI